MRVPGQSVFERGRGLPQAEFEKLICGFPREIVTAYRTDGTQLFDPLEGEVDRVALPSREKVDLRDAILIHNHPRFRTLSPQDIQVAARRSVRSMVVVLPNGTALRLGVTNPTEWPLEELLERNYEAWWALSRSGSALPPEGEEGTITLHRAAMENQRRLFAEIGVILSYGELQP